MASRPDWSRRRRRCERVDLAPVDVGGAGAGGRGEIGGSGSGSVRLCLRLANSHTDLQRVRLDCLFR